MTVARPSHAGSHVEGDPRAGAPARVVWNQREGRLRAGWRLLGFFALLMVVAAGEGRLRSTLAGHLPDLDDAVVRALAFALMIAAVLLLAGRVLDRRRVADFGLHLSRRWWSDLARGLGLGAGLMLGVLALELAMGWVKITDTFVASPGQPFAATIVLGLVAVVAVAFGEEASYRGYPVKNLTEAFGRSCVADVATVSIPALFFGMAHVFVPGRDLAELGQHGDLRCLVRDCLSADRRTRLPHRPAPCLGLPAGHPCSASSTPEHITGRFSCSLPAAVRQLAGPACRTASRPESWEPSPSAPAS